MKRTNLMKRRNRSSLVVKFTMSFTTVCIYWRLIYQQKRVLCHCTNRIIRMNNITKHTGLAMTFYTNKSSLFLKSTRYLAVCLCLTLYLLTINIPAETSISPLRKYECNGKFRDKSSLVVNSTRHHPDDCPCLLTINLLRWNDVPRTSRIFCSKIVIFSQF